jgi:hypothetical protein
MPFFPGHPIIDTFLAQFAQIAYALGSDCVLRAFPLIIGHFPGSPGSVPAKRAVWAQN